MAYFSEKDYFLKTAKVFGADIEPARKALIRKGFDGYNLNRELGYLEFPVQKIRALRELPLEVGISYGVLETRGRDKVLRELKVALTTPQSFDIEKDV
jgi:hypothetical protein